MTITTLQRKSDIVAARRALRQLQLSGLSPWPILLLRRLGHKLGLVESISIGDFLKSWDVWQTVQFLQTHVSSATSILDIGAFGSEITSALWRAGYTSLLGLDLDRRLGRMPQRRHIHFVVADFMRAPLASGSCGVVTAISVIEHGFHGETLLAEVARLLRRGGYFIASFDYWPQKLDTAGIRLFGMDWRIFSQAEVLDLIATAAQAGLYPVGPLQLVVETPTIHWGARAYTFAWCALQKRAA
jgi:SAM-dependent methyltransferase